MRSEAVFKIRSSRTSRVCSLSRSSRPCLLESLQGLLESRKRRHLVGDLLQFLPKVEDLGA